MEPETVALLGGLLFLLIAIVGGGFTIREIIMPAVPRWGRLASLLVGAALVVPYFVSATGGGEPGPGARSAPRFASPAQAGIVYSDAEADVSADQIELSGLVAVGPHSDPVVGDRIEIEFSLRNVGDAELAFEETFIAARSSNGENKDFANGNHGRLLAPGDVLKVTSSIILDSPGIWRFWPCYALGGGPEERLCPDEWRSFEVSVAA